jgi:cobalamin biosynthesis Mg chelatase CobN
MVTNECGGRWW